MLRWRPVKLGLIWLGLWVPLGLYGAAVIHRPGHAISGQPLFQGMVYSRRLAARPRPQIIHIIEIDLTAPGLTPLVTPGYEGADRSQSGLVRREVLALRTSEFLTEQGLQLAVNANFFYEFREVTPWNYYPRSGQPANLVGLAISNGETVSERNPNGRALPSLCFEGQRAEMRGDGTCGSGTQQAIAGNLLLLEKGRPTETVQTQIGYEGNKPYPFTVAALDASGTRLWLMLTDGKQPLYSEGTTLGEITELVQELGADTAMRLDGGGSTTIAIATPTGPTLLNSPIHGKIPGNERPVANHHGFFAQHLDGAP